jgi:hypothetical protein
MYDDGFSTAVTHDAMICGHSYAGRPRETTGIYNQPSAPHGLQLKGREKLHTTFSNAVDTGSNQH